MNSKHCTAFKYLGGLNMSQNVSEIVLDQNDFIHWIEHINISNDW